MNVLKPLEKMLISAIKLFIRMHQSIGNFGKCSRRIGLARRRKRRRKMARKNDISHYIALYSQLITLFYQISTNGVQLPLSIPKLHL